MTLTAKPEASPKEDTPNPGEALRWIAGILQRRNIPFQITGGLAAKVYGSPRALNDIDIDIPEDRMQEIIDDVRSFVVEGPARYQDAKWDLLLMTLNYNGQEIDIGGAFQTRIRDPKTGEWSPHPADLARAQTRSVLGLELPVVDPEQLISYKTMLDGNHQRIDIDAVLHTLRQEKGT